MRQRRFVSLTEEDGHALLETTDGVERFTLPVDAALRDAVRADLPRLAPLPAAPPPEPIAPPPPPPRSRSPPRRRLRRPWPRGPRRPRRWRRSARARSRCASAPARPRPT